MSHDHLTLTRDQQRWPSAIQRVRVIVKDVTSLKCGTKNLAMIRHLEMSVATEDLVIFH